MKKSVLFVLICLSWLNASHAQCPEPPTAGNNGNFCETSGQTLILSSREIVGATYNWTGPNGFTSTLQSPVINNITMKDTGMYYVTATLNGCTSAPSGTRVIMNVIPPAPISGSNGPYLCEGETLKLTATDVPRAEYIWTGPNGFTSNVQNPVLNNFSLVNGGTYNVIAKVDGCGSPAAITTVILRPPPVAAILNNGPLCEGQTLNLTATNTPGLLYSWTGPNGFTSSDPSPVINNVSVANAGVYTLTVTGCISVSYTTSVVVNPAAAPLAGNNGPVCIGQTLNLTASSIPGAAYSWTGPNGFTSNLQNPVINNIALVNTGDYFVSATVNGCTSLKGVTKVSVFSAPQAPVAGNNGPKFCGGETLQLTASDIAGATYSWTGPNGFTSNVQNPVINNITDVNSGVYSVVAEVGGCKSTAASTSISLLPPPVINLTNNGPLCIGQTLNLTSNTIAGATYNWTGPGGFTSNVQNPVINNVAVANAGVYTLMVNGCNYASNTTTVIINPPPPAPLANSSGPSCMGQTVSLTASSIPGATYNWTGPNGFASSIQNPVINNVALVDSGIYKVIATVNNCPGSPGSTAVIVMDSARANSGGDQYVCGYNSVVYLSGKISGGSTTGIWSTSGLGTFSPNNTSLNAEYNITAADRAAGNVRITLTSTNNGVCPASASSMTVTLPTTVIVRAGIDQVICANDTAILNGQVFAASGGVWVSSGNGRFIPDNTSLNAKYIPGTQDKASGRVILKLSSTGNGLCIPTFDELNISIEPGPAVNAGPDRFVLENEKIVLEPIVTGANPTYLWTPALYLNNNTIKNPVYTAVNDQVYTLEVTDANGCMNKDDVSVKVLQIPDIPNTFTPNNDGINDLWVIKNLEKYPTSKVQIFNRYGQIVFESTGYKPWDGTMKGKALPFGTYYYVIEPGFGARPFTGYVTLIK